MPECPVCAMEGSILCAYYGRLKVPGSDGHWVGNWWYCGLECTLHPKAPGVLCERHKAAMVRVNFPGGTL